MDDTRDTSEHVVNLCMSNFNNNPIKLLISGHYVENSPLINLFIKISISKLWSTLFLQECSYPHLKLVESLINFSCDICTVLYLKSFFDQDKEPQICGTFIN